MFRFPVRVLDLVLKNSPGTPEFSGTYRNQSEFRCIPDSVPLSGSFWDPKNPEDATKSPTGERMLNKPLTRFKFEHEREMLMGWPPRSARGRVSRESTQTNCV
jgi:hypothetical protein